MVLKIYKFENYIFECVRLSTLARFNVKGNNDFMRRQFANQDPSRTNMLILTLGHRMAQAAKLRGAHAQMVHAISCNFTIKDTNQIMEQLFQRCQGNLDQYMQDKMLMNNHCLEIVHSLNLTMLDQMLPVDD